MSSISQKVMVEVLINEGISFVVGRYPSGKKPEIKSGEKFMRQFQHHAEEWTIYGIYYSFLDRQDHIVCHNVNGNTQTWTRSSFIEDKNVLGL